MLLQRIIAKFIMLAMLFTVTLSPVSAMALLGKPILETSCHSAMMPSCCAGSHSEHNDNSSICNSDDMTGAHHATQCCGDNNCHTNNIPFAILTDNKLLAIPSPIAEFTEPDGKRLFFQELLLRPPMSV